jgi:hypothetical protein
MNDLRVGELTITPSMLDQGKTYKAVPAAAWRDYLAGHGWRLVHTDEKGVTWHYHNRKPKVPASRRWQPHRPGYDTAANIPAEAYTAVADGKLLVSVIPEHFGDYVTWSFSLLSDLERHEDRWKGFILAEVLQHSEASP